MSRTLVHKGYVWPTSTYREKEDSSLSVRSIAWIILRKIQSFLQEGTDMLPAT